ncbi:MAG TPA: 7-cyano-7-deazaguanine synthase QueC [Nitrospirota bacterium]|nr:7-cyano-7-deazaguanine synthase QueC [Nitrospirota bacterium]
MQNQKAIILVSGGMDSCVTAAIAHENYHLAFLHVKYGQRTEGRELQAFNKIADFYNVENRLTVNLTHLKIIGGSSLTDKSIPIPECGPAQLELGNLSSAIPSTYVPFRNAHLLCCATSWAEVLEANKIFIGAVEEDSSGYPDCREIFYQAFNKAIETGTRPETRVEIVTPLIHMKKSDIVSMGMRLGAPLHLTWSCYQQSTKACGKCESCVLRLKGFREAGINDPIPYDT